MSRRIPFIILVAFAILASPALVAAAEPFLLTSGIPGQEIDVSGIGFPGDADVLLEIQRNGVASGSQTLHTDAAGSFTAKIEAGPGQGGRYTLIATSGSARAVAEVVAVETAGGGGTGAQPTLPAGTDTAPNVSTRLAAANDWVPAFFVMVLSLLAIWWYLREGAVRRRG
jgi:hypothetical protein